ncbi:hypothetical protein [Paludisphaera mucosa]|uniref:SHSP domain-containing protein n=1 Tax=Paludisphaera mucosa TaxID=3030827 RepID=A0ABT6F9S8_9BACT|nr:hypothetical protein [Paludisphaera mucosa]MDG3004189.1 hypothetical protein [Paludisphaera mucosa]
MSETLPFASLPALRPTSMEPSPRRSVAELVHDLLGGLARLDARKGSRRLKQSVHRYHDAEFNYMEVALPGLDGVEADICIHDGCIYVRILR